VVVCDYFRLLYFVFVLFLCAVLGVSFHMFLWFVWCFCEICVLVCGCVSWPVVCFCSMFRLFCVYVCPVHGLFCVCVCASHCILCRRGVWLVVYLCLPGALNFVCLFGVYVCEARGPFVFVCAWRVAFGCRSVLNFVVCVSLYACFVGLDILCLGVGGIMQCSCDCSVFVLEFV